MEHQVTGKLELLLPVETGTSKAGKEWTRQSFVINTGDQYNGTYCFNVFGQEKVNGLANLKPGQVLNVKFNVECREWQGKYYTNLQAWQILPAQQQEQQPVQSTSNAPF